MRAFMWFYLGLSISFIALAAVSCGEKPSNEIDALAEKVISKKEGVRFEIDPVDPKEK